MNLAQTTVSNMAEDLTMLVSYSVVNQYIHDVLADFFPDELDENGRPKLNVALEVFSGGASYLFMSSIMAIIRREEKFIEYLFIAGETIIAVWWSKNKGYFDAMKNKIMSTKGYKAVARMKSSVSQVDNTNSYISQVYEAIRAVNDGRNSSSNVASTIQASNSSMDTAINREAHDLKLAELRNKTFSSTLFMKTATGTYTQADKTIIQKMIGRDQFANTPIDIDELNKLHEVLYLQSSDGKFHGLPTVMSTLINGLGFLKAS